MNLHAIHHVSKSNYCYMYNEKTMQIKLRVAKNDINEVALVYGDKFDWDNKQEKKMTKLCSAGLFDYFVVEVEPINNRIAYFFEISSDNEKVYYTDSGFLDEINNEEVHFSFFQIAYIHNTEIHKAPDWVRDAVFYQIFPERFNNGDTSNDPAEVKNWGGKATNDKFFGGDLQGIIDKLDYLHNLGITAIYLTPIFEAETSHKYDTTNYFLVDKHFGDLKELKNLVNECHKRGMKIVLDAVFNHCGFLFSQFQDVIRSGEKSKYVDWFHIEKLPIKTEPPNYEAFAFVPTMPKLNTKNPEVKKFLLDVASYWIDETGIDGWRLDVADEIDHEFWRDFRRVVKAAKSDAYIVGEVWSGALPWLKGDQYDSIMNYSFMKHSLDFFARNTISAKVFKESINEMRTRNTMQVNEVMLNLLDSHDTARFLTMCKNDVKKLMLAVTFQLMYDGAPCIYYGTEVGLDGKGDPDNRKTMIWDEKKWDKKILNHYKKLLKIRKDFKELRRGSFEWVEDLGEVIGFKRVLGKNTIVILINNQDKDCTVILKVRGVLSDVISGCEVNQECVQVDACSSRIMSVEDRQKELLGSL